MYYEFMPLAHRNKHLLSFLSLTYHPGIFQAAATNKGKLVHDNTYQEYGLPVVPGDVVGCFLELGGENRTKPMLSLQWSYNGRLLGVAKPKNIVPIRPNEPLFPSEHECVVYNLTHYNGP